MLVLSIYYRNIWENMYDPFIVPISGHGHSAQVQYRVEYVLIADTCCKHLNIKWSANVGLEYRTDSTMSWERLQNFTDIES